MILNFFKDVNECLMDNGGCEQECVNKEGFFICVCKLGYRFVFNNRVVFVSIKLFNFYNSESFLLLNFNKSFYYLI